MTCWSLILISVKCGNPVGRCLCRVAQAMPTSVGREVGRMFVKEDQAFRSIILTAICAFTAVPALAQAPATGAVTPPEIPAPVAVTVDAKSSVLLILDISTAICKPNPACMATVPAIAALAKKARDAKVP